MKDGTASGTLLLKPLQTFKFLKHLYLSVKKAAGLYHSLGRDNIGTLPLNGEEIGPGSTFPVTGGKNASNLIILNEAIYLFDYRRGRVLL